MLLEEAGRGELSPDIALVTASDTGQQPPVCTLHTEGDGVSQWPWFLCGGGVHWSSGLAFRDGSCSPETPQALGVFSLPWRHGSPEML